MSISVEQEDIRKAYFDNLKHVGKVIKQLTFCSHIKPFILGPPVQSHDDVDDTGGGSKIGQKLMV